MADKTLKRNVEDVMPVATGHEREELEAELEVKNSHLLLSWMSLEILSGCTS